VELNRIISRTGRQPFRPSVTPKYCNVGVEEVAMLTALKGVECVLGVEVRLVSHCNFSVEEVIQRPGWGEAITKPP
jgi:hypothetical protein